MNRRRLWQDMVVAGVMLGAVGFIPATATPANPVAKSELAARRARLADVAGPGSLVILPAHQAPTRSGDTSYEFRQDSSLYYLTGIEQEETTLVLMPGNDSLREILFLLPRDPARETWDGKRLTVPEASAISGIEVVWDAGRLTPFLEAAAAGRTYGVSRYTGSKDFQSFRNALGRGEASIWMPQNDPAGLADPPDAMQRLADDLRRRYVGFAIRDLQPALEHLRQIKSPGEVALLQQAIDITLEAQREAMRLAGAGKTEYEIEAAIEYVFRRQGASGWAFPSIVASGDNATTLHYQENMKLMDGGDLLLMDLGAEYGLYAADITRTVPVSGRFAPEQAAIYAIVLEAQNEAMKLVRPGATLAEIHGRSVEVVAAGLLRLGLITDTGGNQYRHFFMHGTCHWLGLEVHDVGDRDAVLAPGMVLTVEPGIYVRRDALENLPPGQDEFRRAVAPAVARYAGIGVRIEDDVLVTGEGFVHLSRALPRRMDEIEELMRQEPVWVTGRP